MVCTDPTAADSRKVDLDIIVQRPVLVGVPASPSFTTDRRNVQFSPSAARGVRKPAGASSRLHAQERANQCVRTESDEHWADGVGDRPSRQGENNVPTVVPEIGARAPERTCC